MADTATLSKNFVSVLEVATGENKPVARLAIHGVVTLKFKGDPDITYTAIRYGNMNILPLLENIPGGDEMMQTIYRTSHNYILDTFDMETLERKDNEPGAILDAVRDEGGAIGPTDPATKAVAE